MKDFDRLVVRFWQFGGWRLAWEYVKMGLLWVIVCEFVRCIVRHQSFKRIYSVIQAKVNRVLVQKYCWDLNADTEQKEECQQLEDIGQAGKSNEKIRVWWCWMQGGDRAPKLAKACLTSLREQLKEVEVVVITAENYREWVELPEHVIKKYERGVIPHVSYTDLIRLALLAKHGGVWIDSTVLYTGGEKVDGDTRPKYHPTWQEIISAELFVFQYTKPGETWTGNVSTWFMSAQPGNPFVKTLLNMMCAYWKDYNCLIQYYMIHLFFAELAKQFPDMIARMPYGWSAPCLQLGRNLGQEYDARKWESFASQVHWHKMNYRYEDRLKDDKDNYYSHIVANCQKPSLRRLTGNEQSNIR